MQPSPRSVSEVGTTTVTCTVVDGAGGTASTSFDVTVRSGVPSNGGTIDPRDVQLPATGSNPSRLAGMATAITLLGLLISALALRRRRHAG